MSTIEKAAARLVRKPKQKSPAGQPNVAAPANAAPALANQVALDAGDQAPLDVSSRAVNLNDNNVVDSNNLVDSNVAQASAAAAATAEAKVAESYVATPAPADVNDFTKACELDFAWLKENGFLVPDHDNPVLGQEFRRIKRPLLLNLQPRIRQEHANPTNIIYVTSALPGEGKTFVSLNLALSIAGELDKSVLLVDGDAAKGDLSKWMGIYDEPGLVDLLTKNQPYGESALIETNVDRLDVMPCGRRTENLDELYASEAMKTLLDGLANKDPGRIIVIDGPPLIPTTEAAVLASLMGQCLFVVEANKTSQAAVKQASAQLKDCQLVSALLNKTKHAELGYGYGYGYGYGREQS